jgi:ribonuclease HI
LETPQEGFVKLNFDKASKGNPGPAGVGGIFRNHQGETLLLYASSLGISTNNATKLAGLRRGMELAIEKGFSMLEVEGDSLLIIRGIQNLMNGGKTKNMIQNWHLNHGFSTLGTLVASISVIVAEPIRREANSVVDCMANVGVTLSEQLWVWLLGDPLPSGLDGQIQHGCLDDLTKWKVAKKHVDRDTCEHGPPHDVLTWDIWHRSALTSVEEIRRGLHIAADMPPEHEATDGHLLGNMLDKMAPLKEKDKHSRDILGKDGPKTG